MVAEIFAGLSSLKTALDLAKGLKDIDDAARRNAAVIELQEKILAAQEAQSTLIQRVHELEGEVARVKAWEAQKQRYELKDFGGGTFAYELRVDEARREPAHRICPACYESGDRSILQFRGQNAFSQDMYFCPLCEQTFNFGTKQPPRQPNRPTPSWIRSRGG